MIFTDSRYADGYLQKNYRARNDSYELSVYRDFPEETSTFIYHVWRTRDRIDKLASRYLGSPKLWYRIMDYNPEIVNVFEIKPGTVLRIPQ